MAAAREGPLQPSTVLPVEARPATPTAASAVFTVEVDGGTGGRVVPAGGVPVAVAVFLSVPACTSACVTV